MQERLRIGSLDRHVLHAAGRGSRESAVRTHSAESNSGAREPLWFDRPLPLDPGVVTIEPVVGARAAVVDPSQLGGTRHLSAAQFVHDQRDALALVASQDGRFTVFGRPPGEDLVHAHRVEALLL